MRLHVLMFVILVVGVSCATIRREPQRDVAFANMHVFPVTHPACKAFVAFQQPEPNEWPLGYLTNDNMFYLIQPRPNILITVMDVQLSPDGERVAIVHEGEGSVEVTFFRMQDLLNSLSSWGAEAAGELRHFDVWPGTCRGFHWVSNAEVELSTDQDFSIFDRVNRAAVVPVERTDTPMQTWRYNLDADSFVRVPR